MPSKTNEFGSGPLEQPSASSSTSASLLPLQILTQLLHQEEATLKRTLTILQSFHRPLGERNRGIITFAQHWTLFANLSTLYESQKSVHERLASAVSVLQQKMEQQDRKRAERDASRKKLANFPPLLCDFQTPKSANKGGRGGASAGRGTTPERLEHRSSMMRHGGLSPPRSPLSVSSQQTTSNPQFPFLVAAATTSRPVVDETMEAKNAAAAAAAAAAGVPRTPTTTVSDSETPPLLGFHSLDIPEESTTVSSPVFVQNLPRAAPVVAQLDVHPLDHFLQQRHDDEPTVVMVPASLPSPSSHGGGGGGGGAAGDGGSPAPTADSDDHLPMDIGAERTFNHTFNNGTLGGTQAAELLVFGSPVQDRNDFLATMTTTLVEGFPTMDAPSSRPPMTPQLLSRPNGTLPLSAPPSGHPLSQQQPTHAHIAGLRTPHSDSFPIPHSRIHPKRTASADDECAHHPRLISQDESVTHNTLSEQLQHTNDEGDFGDDEEEDEDVLVQQLVQIIEGVFCHASMMHLQAEHMMYTLHCTKSIFPTLTALIDAVVKASKLSASNSSPFAAFAAEWRNATQNNNSSNSEGRASLLGKESKPATSSTTTTSEMVPVAAAFTMPQNAASWSNLLRQYSNFLQFCAQVLTDGSLTDLSKELLPDVDPSLGTARGRAEAAPIEELLLHLAAPLPSVQRYVHAARCLITTRVLPEHAEYTLRSKFLDNAYDRLAEEGTLVLDQVAQQDIATILNNMDDFTAGANESRVLIHYGRLVKRFRRGRHERLMFVFSDVLCYVEELSNGRHRVRGTIPLSHVVQLTEGNSNELPSASAGNPAGHHHNTEPPPPSRSSFGAPDISPRKSQQQPSSTKTMYLEVTDVEDDLSENISNAFTLLSPSTSVPYLFFCATAQQKAYWLNILRYVVMLAKKAASQSMIQQQTGTVPSLVRCAVLEVPRTSRLARQRRDDERKTLRQTKALQAAERFQQGLPSTTSGKQSSAATRPPPLQSVPSPAAVTPLHLASSLGASTRNATNLLLHRENSGTGSQLKLPPSSTTLRGSYDMSVWARGASAASLHHRVRSMDVLHELERRKQQDASSSAAQESERFGIEDVISPELMRSLASPLRGSLAAPLRYEHRDPQHMVDLVEPPVSFQTLVQRADSNQSA